MPFPFAFLQGSTASGGTPWYEAYTWMTPQEEYERALLEPYSGVTTPEQFQTFGTGQGGPELSAGERVKNALDWKDAVLFGINPVAGAANLAKDVYGDKAGKWVLNGGVALLGVVLIIGAFMLIARGDLK